jgi:imidazolonepropionase-like amidohydrolase
MPARLLLLLSVLLAAPAAADTLGDSQIGRIAPGYSADLIAVSGDPLRNVRLLQHVDYVMVRGKEAP